ncbi:PREDICTED: heavy metal-associated isoprenylated plant protein 20-like [Nelumbo nucifera]|uniref:Heavy metal-associated isoprenylated plant protein 20-like n=1 Tax=Nelumbo nucifera TaxID=4432 RepID=A0A1U7ZPA9_NELNU|nr:PREDICTED: heavy metal-associated isoprenylated plant protein 20-like [Nelumbo nucifera]
MADEKKSLDRVTVELKVSMHCNACERTVAKTLSKFKGVEKFSTDMINQKVIVIGRINPQKVLKKLRKKTGKRVEIEMDNDASKDTSDEKDLALVNCSSEGQNLLTFEDWEDSVIFTMFSDENANACTIL